MKRYIVTHEQLEAFNNACFDAGQITMVGTRERYEQAMKDLVDTSIECRRIEVPEWATYFSGHNDQFPFKEDAAMRFMEIPK